VARRAPLVEDCTDKPGKFYVSPLLMNMTYYGCFDPLTTLSSQGYEEICELGYCEKVTVEYDIDKLI
jgi:hypothetical protein